MGYGPCENGEWQAPEVVIICFVFFSRMSHYGPFTCLVTPTLTLFSISACWYKQCVF